VKYIFISLEFGILVAFFGHFVVFLLFLNVFIFAVMLLV